MNDTPQFTIEHITIKLKSGIPYSKLIQIIQPVNDAHRHKSRIYSSVSGNCLNILELDNDLVIGPGPENTMLFDDGSDSRKPGK